MSDQPRRWEPIPDAGVDVPVREDRVTKADINAVARLLYLRDERGEDFPSVGWDREGEAFRTLYRLSAVQLLSVVLGA